MRDLSCKETMPASRTPVSRARFFQNRLLAWLEGHGRGRVACGVYASYLIAGAARLHRLDEIDSPGRKEKGEAWRDSIHAQFRGDVGNFKQSHDLEIQAVRVHCRGIGDGVNGS